jgi:hypothetical protein
MGLFFLFIAIGNIGVMPPEISAVNNLDTILSTERDYYSDKRVYGTLEQISNGKMMSLCGTWHGYDYRYAVTVSPDGKHFKATANPDKPRKKNNGRFYVDDSGVIRATYDGSEPNDKSRNIRE